MRRRETLRDHETVNRVTEGPASPDPLLYGTELSLTGSYHPLGFPVTVLTNSSSVLDAAERSWGPFPKLFDETALEIRIVVGEQGSPAPGATPAVRGQQHLVTIVADGANFAVCDYRARFGFCWITGASVRDQRYFRWHFLEAMVYVLLTQLHLTPIHGAFVARNGHGLLLCGEAGSGKSTLSFACARAGWTFLSDDTSYMLRRSDEAMVLGKPLQISLREDAPRLFPELAGREPVVTANGKTAVELSTSGMPNLTVAFQHAADTIVFLRRDGTEPARVSPVERATVIARLAKEIPMLGGEVHREQVASLEKLAAKPTFELHYGALDSAVDALGRLTTTVPATAHTLSR